MVREVNDNVEQLVLPVAPLADQTLTNFITRSNEQLVEHLVQAMLDFQQCDKTQLYYIHGNSGTGKTHLALALAHFAEKQNYEARYIDLKSILHMPSQLLDGFVHSDCLIFDNTDSCKENMNWQRGLFDIVNQCIEESPKLVIFFSQRSVLATEFELPDLASRLTWGTTYQLTPLDDDSMHQAFQSAALAKGMLASKEVVDFIVRRSGRNMHDLMLILDTLDKASLQSQRKLTIPFVKETLAY